MPKKTEIEKIFPRGFWGAFLALREGHPWTWLTGSPAIPTYPPFPRSVWRESFSHMPILPMPMPSVQPGVGGLSGKRERIKRVRERE